MSTHEDLMNERRKKRDALTVAGMNPYTAKAHATHTNAVVLEKFSKFVASVESVTLAGRVMALRLHGALAFTDIFDGTARVQVMFTKENVGE